MVRVDVFPLVGEGVKIVNVGFVAVPPFLGELGPGGGCEG